ncbi:mitochondrial fission protein ELM1-like isoform X2 [Mangifera indica]|uniref:mitochondrial fission protein ELM1-like isoform X2 n=1 Tax=Mangifera indica TaxID=29780 RepID=UPI001CFC1E01|nr:mitochondrial fission protein ELM1-like isoform X2 [Mangifera indica]
MEETFDGGSYGRIRRAVVIGNGFSGAENQCIGLVRALGLSRRHILFRVTRPRGGINEWLHWLPVSLHKKVGYFIKRICGDSRFRFIAPKSDLSVVLEADAKQIAGMAHQTFEKDGPLLVVASGRDTISVASSIKQLAPENVFVIQIQHPRSQLSRFDLVITPRHDYYPLTPHAQEQIPWFLRRWITPCEPPGRHVVLTVGALHQADSAALRRAASVWHDELALLPKPLLVVNVGGPTSNCLYGADLAKQLTSMLQDVLWSCGSVRISFSRRTPEKVAKIIIKEFHNNPKVNVWNSEDPNPHMGHLALADAFVITADSPVYVVGAEQCTWKFADFQKSLLERGYVRPFTGKEDISKNWSYSPLNDLAEAANQVNTALAERGWRIHP